MEEEQTPASIPEAIQLPPRPPDDSRGSGVKKALGPVAALAALLFKFKGFLFLAVKFLPTLGSMFVSMWAYALLWGWRFAAGFVVLIFVHECGHLLVARRPGLKVGAPMFIPFMGAIIMLKEMPRNAWIEAQVGIGGPILGSVGAAVCYAVYCATGNGLFGGLAYTGFFINLFNLAPFGFLDGGRIVTALSPWLWLVGLVIIGSMMFLHFNLLLLIIVIMSLPRLFSLFRKKSTEEARYFEVTPQQRWIMGGMYFGLIVLLVLGMVASRVQTGDDNGRRGETISYVPALHIDEDSTGGSTGVGKRFFFAPGGLDGLYCFDREAQNRRRWNDRNDRNARWEEKVAATIAACPDIALLGQTGQRADGQANMTFTADAIPHDGHALLALRHQPVIAGQDGFRDGLAQSFDAPLAVPLTRTRLKLECLKGEQVFHDILHRPLA
jgi:Zn-dependent protease